MGERWCVSEALLAAHILELGGMPTRDRPDYEGSS